MLRVIDRLNVGGPALQITVLSEGLDPDRFEHRILAGTIEPGEGDYVTLRAPDLPVQWINGLGHAPRLRNDAAAFAEVVRVIREFRPHIVHTHKAKAGVLGRVAGWANGVPATVHHFHGHLLHGYFSPSKTRAVVTAERLLALRTTRLVAVGSQVRDDLLAAKVGRPGQWRVVAPGVTTRALPDRATARAELGLRSDGSVVGFVGRLTQVKRPERFVDMAIALVADHPETSFVVAGEGELMDSVRQRARPLGDRIVFLGWRGDVEVVYAACDVVALTSDNEGMPVSLIEASAAGIPVISTRVGSAGEVVVDGVTGFLTDINTRALTEAAARLLGDEPLRRAMGDAARAYSDQNFGAARLVRDVTGLYEEIAAELDLP